MSVTAYVLIQTEVGRAEKVATAVRDIAGVVDADDVTGPYDVIVKAEADTLDELGQAGRVGDPDGRRHHPHLHLPRRQPLDASSTALPAGALGPAGVAVEREVDEAVEQLRVRTARSPPTASGTSRSA